MALIKKAHFAHLPQVIFLDPCVLVPALAAASLVRQVRAVSNRRSLRLLIGLNGLVSSEQKASVCTVMYPLRRANCPMVAFCSLGLEQHVAILPVLLIDRLAVAAKGVACAVLSTAPVGSLARRDHPVHAVELLSGAAEHVVACRVLVHREATRHVP